MSIIFVKKAAADAAEEAGKEAFLSELSRDANPHTPKTMLWMYWNIGWDIAKKIMEKE